MATNDHISTKGRDADSRADALVHSREFDHFRIPDGDPDPRGWDVRSADGRKLGKVDDLLVERGSGRIRYLEVKVDNDVAKNGGREWALLPIGTAQLDDAHDDVIVSIAAGELAGCPEYRRGRVTRDQEVAVRDWARERGRPATAAGGVTTDRLASDRTVDQEADFYGSPEYDDQRFFQGRRMRGSGAADRAERHGIVDRVTDRLDDLKDRVDGDPASRPGPDPTDRRL